jgi:hypothetical protein
MHEALVSFADNSPLIANIRETADMAARVGHRSRT